MPGPSVDRPAPRSTVNARESGPDRTAGPRRARHVGLLAVLAALAVGVAVRLVAGPPVVAWHHLLALVTAFAVYLLLLRWGVWHWLAAVATVPVLAAELAGDYLPVADAVVVPLVAVALLALCHHARPDPVGAAVGGALLAVASIVRPEGAPLVLAAVAYVVMSGSTWRRRLTGAGLVAVGSSLPLVAYVAWTDHLPSAGAGYQGQSFLPDPFFFGLALLGLVAAAGVGRARGSGMRAVCLLGAVVPVAMMLGAAVTGGVSWDQQPATAVLLPAAGALAMTALLRGRRGAAAGRPQVDDVDRAASTDFHERYGTPRLAPVVVVIAAYNEAVGLPRVLADLPRTVCGLDTDVVVVDDGSTDATASAAHAHGDAFVVTCPVNRGQGAAMRLGYRVARSHGARLLITTDADAQYDTADLPVVLAPLLDGSADFVTGSRLLGRQQTNDRFRRTGVHVFAWVVSALTGQRFTDTSFGLRAMQASLTASVTLNQPQYQSAELLIGAHSHGYRIAEVPGTMHLRAAGSTKKGGNLVYGTRYARVVLGTWWREGCPAPVRERAPALLGPRGFERAPAAPCR